MTQNSFAAWFSVAICFFANQLMFGQNTIIENKILQLQQSGANFEAHTALFAALPITKNPQTELERQAQRLLLDKPTLEKIISRRAANLTISMPLNGQIVTLDLYQSNVVTQDFTVKTGVWKSEPYVAGVYYRGIIRGVPHSLAAVSFFDNEIMGVLSHPTLGNLNLGKLDRAGNDAIYTLYSENLLPPNPFSECQTRPGDQTGKPQDISAENISGCVRIFMEANYALYVNKGSIANTVNYVTGFFNAVSTIYSNEQITISMSQIYVWTSQDPYPTSGSGAALDAFVAYRTSFDGDLAHLITLENYGGVAYLGVLCSATANFAVSGVDETFQGYPTYSWTVEVVAHEMGHNFGSNHTHWCGWAGGAIDNCGPTAGYGFETPPVCTTAPTPAAGGGTIMSYCHLVGSVGINLANGFGPLPGNAIRAATTAALNGNCITANCPTYSCGEPTALTITAITTTSATIGWTAVAGASTYKLQYRVSGTANWTSINAITSIPYNLNTLSAASTYEIQVQAICGANGSGYLNGVIFKTLTSLCAEPSVLTATAVNSTSVTLNWTENGSATTWEIQHGPAGFSLGVGTTVTVTAKPFLLTGLTANTSYDYYVRANCGGAVGNSSWVGPKNFSTPTINDLATNAIEIILNATCSGNIYTNSGSGVSSGELSPTSGNGGYWATGASNTVWFKFVAPPSGSVKITTDIAPLGTLDDTQFALYNTVNPTSGNNHLLLSNEDGGANGAGYATLGYYSGLTSGTTYYIQVDGYGSAVGTFCMEVRETFDLPAPTTCASYTQVVNGSTASSKWFNVYSKPNSDNIGLPVAAIKSTLNLGTVTVQEIRNATVLAAGNGVKYMQRYYNFECTANSTAPKQVRLFYTTTELNSLKTAAGLPASTADDLNISHYDGTNENCGLNDNGATTYSVISAVSATQIASSGYFYLEFTSPSFSEMGAMFGLVALPIELLSFTAAADGQINTLNWETAAEENLEKYVVERSADGIQNWAEISSQSPSPSLKYQSIDAQPLAQSYYRLAILSRDGSRDYSKIISIGRKVADGIQSIAPNPAQNSIFVAYNSTAEQSVRFRIIAADGRLVLEQPIDLMNGFNLVPFDISGLPTGLYYCLTNGSDGMPFVKM